MRQRGFTMLELMIGLVLMGVLGTATYRVLLTTQRVSRGQAERTNLQSNVRAAGAFLPAELREIGYDQSPTTGAVTTDLVLGAPNRIVFRAARGMGFTCDDATVGTFVSEVWLRTSTILGQSGRLPRVSDEFRLFVDGNENQGKDDEWRPMEADAVETGTCPDGAAAVRIRFAVGTGPQSTTFHLGGPVRFYERVDYGLMTDGGRPWLGFRSLSTADAAYQPLVGPLADAGGFQVAYLNAAGTPTTDMRQVRTLQITLRGRSEGAGAITGSGAAAAGELDMVTRVALRNSLRP